MESFFQSFSLPVSQELNLRFSRAVARDVPSTLPLLAKVIDEQWLDVVGTSVDYQYESSVLDLIAQRQILALFSKNASLPTGIDKRKVAIDKFFESEQQCKAANARIKRWRMGVNLDPYVESVLFTAKRKIATILGSSDAVLGSFPELSELDCCFGPGSNVNVKKYTSARWKLESKPSCSSNMIGTVSEVLSEFPLLCDVHCKSYNIQDPTEVKWVVDVDVLPGKLMFVAKNAKTDRSIIVEPNLNTLVQKGIGSFLKDRLLRFGVNLRDQAEGKNSNQNRARLASIENHLSTVDLSSASDCISTELVYDLLPYDWFCLLDNCRTSEVLLDEQELKLEKFSSMGNGFTFELESMIFYALTCAICEIEGIRPDVTVYGDDIICPATIVDRLFDVFSAVGFTVNKEKTFTEGPFRESCGGDFFLGQDVRPYYQKDLWCEADLYSFYNFLTRKNWQFLLPSLYEAVRKSIRQDSIIYGPDGFGDGHVIGPYARTRKPQHVKDGWEGNIFQTRIQKVAKKHAILKLGDAIYPFYQVYRRAEPCNPSAVRGDTRRCRLINIYTLARF